jgi:hypothetical protein
VGIFGLKEKTADSRVVARWGWEEKGEKVKRFSFLMRSPFVHNFHFRVI